MRTIKTEIMGKERSITSGTDIDGVFFLDKSDDMYGIGIYCGLSLAQWTNPAYLQSKSILEEKKKMRKLGDKVMVWGAFAGQKKMWEGRVTKINRKTDEVTVRGVGRDFFCKRIPKV